MGTYLSPSAPSPNVAFMLNAESRVLLGTETMYGSLEVASWVYVTYTASICLQAGKSLDLGSLEAFGFSHIPSYEAVESANIQSSNIWTLTGEECTLTVGLREFHPSVINLAIGTGVFYALGDEVVITFGGRCDMQSRPICVQFSNVSCDAPTAEDISGGVSGGALTLYDCFCSSGLPWDDINAGALNVLTLEFQVRPVLALSRGNRLGSLYLF